MRGNEALVRRIQTLLKSWRMTYEQVDKMLCLKQGTAERLVRTWAS
jgi:hypothetical protein